jgi:ankyrin repeat protein
LIVGYLLHYQANVELADASGRTPLMLASQGGHLPVVVLLLNNQAHINSIDSKGIFNTKLYSPLELLFL